MFLSLLFRIVQEPRSKVGVELFDSEAHGNFITGDNCRFFIGRFAPFSLPGCFK